LGRSPPIRNDLPELIHVIVLDPLEAYEAGEVPAATVSMQGEEYLLRHGPAFEARWQAVAESDPCQHLLHLGTTADPKGIVLTHRNYTANIEQGRGDDSAAGGLGHAQTSCPGSRVRPHVRHLHDDEPRRGPGLGPGGQDADGDGQEHPREHPGDAATILP